MKILTSELFLQTKEYCEFIDITEQVEDFVISSWVKNWIISIHSLHTTVAIRINERETGLKHDFKVFASKFVPKDDYYQHNDTSIRTENLVCDPNASDCLNAHSHITHLFMGTSEIVPIKDWKLILWTWQRIFAIELDCARKRYVHLQVMGV
jgi:secondary thiamine-phosphate synthase enzyme